jgi:hypothetical protein
MCSEADLARSVLTELQHQGYETYEEVSAIGKRADIVAVRGRVIMVVETKTALSLQLLDQLARWDGFAHYIIAAVPLGRVSAAAQQWLRHHGHGLWKVGCDEIHEDISPRLARTALDHWIRNALSPEQRSGDYAKAGSNSGGYWTPFRNTCKELQRIVQSEPGIELRVALGKFSHHYASAKSARSALPGLIRKGIVQGIRLDDSERRLRLYPETSMTAPTQPRTPAVTDTTTETHEAR